MKCTNKDICQALCTGRSLSFRTWFECYCRAHDKFTEEELKHNVKLSFERPEEVFAVWPIVMEICKNFEVNKRYDPEAAWISIGSKGIVYESLMKRIDEYEAQNDVP